MEPDDRASQRGKRKRSEKKADEQAQAPAEEPKVSAAKGDGKPRKLRGKREWKTIDEPESGRAEPTAEPAGAATAMAATSEEKDSSEPSPRKRDSDSEHGQRSDVDAMGQDKHRRVIGQRYGASRGRQLLYYGLFVAFVVAVYLGGQAAVSHFDKAPKHDKAQAPWAQKGAPDIPLGGFEPRNAGQKGPTKFQ